MDNKKKKLYNEYYYFTKILGGARKSIKINKYLKRWTILKL